MLKLWMDDPPLHSVLWIKRKFINIVIQENIYLIDVKKSSHLGSSAHIPTDLHGTSTAIFIYDLKINHDK